MIYLALGLVVLVVVSQRNRTRRDGLARRVGAGLGNAAAVWRPTAGLVAAALTVLALVLFVREDWIVAGGVAVAALVCALGARRRGASAAGSARGMSLQDARAILGVGPGADPGEIRAAHRRLIRTVHPDRGGTGGLAAQLNAARDRLLAETP